ncbi:phosphoribosyltransferase domain-containing protein [bacterium]|nr:phosphoribosyltransferase domain-containing protein [bacterium]
MTTYCEADLVCIAKRYNNSKRNYLIVNPLQAKHIPVSPERSLAMMETLGRILVEEAPSTKLLIGFAETATALGAAVANCLDQNCIYIHTTRENREKNTSWACFSEEHSHATAQKICVEKFNEWLEETTHVIFLDDELTTGKTLLNIISELKKMFPQLQEKRITAASLINRLSAENLAKLAENGVSCASLVYIDRSDYEQKAEQYAVCAPQRPMLSNTAPLCSLTILPETMELGADPRLGVKIGIYHEKCVTCARKLAVSLRKRLEHSNKVLVLGTEECMYPALILGRELEKLGAAQVRCHATTRSPIGISNESSYPITQGFELTSLYEAERTTYIYNLEQYDTAIIVSDAEDLQDADLKDLQAALSLNGCGQIFYVKVR